METVCLFSRPMSSHTSQWQPGLLPGGCSKSSPRLESIRRSGLHTPWERLQVLTTPQLGNLTWDKFVDWQTGPWPVVFTSNSTSSTFDTMTFGLLGGAFNTIPSSSLFYSVLYWILWYIMIYFLEYIFENIIFCSYIWIYIFSPFGWCSYWLLEVQDTMWPLF